MGSLPVTMPEVHSAFKDGQFFVQMSRNNPFGHNEADKTIENTINRDWRRLVAHLWQRQISSMRLHWFFAATQIFFFCNLFIFFNNALQYLESVFSNPWAKESDLTTLSTGEAATTEMRNDLLQARERGQKALNQWLLIFGNSKFLRSFKKNEAEVIQRSQDYHKDSHQGSCASPTNVSSFVCANGSAWAVPENRHENSVHVSLVPCRSLWSALEDKQVKKKNSQQLERQ